ncbi:MAG: hypothetical protein ACREPM_18530, partial [Gemmatimonadaceae bacterium]
MQRIELRRRVWTAAACAAIALAGVPTREVRAQQIPILLEGVGDGEFWSTTQHSNLLTRNDGRGSGLGRVSIWGAIEPLPGLVFF